jgi:hypothetical protein
VRRTGSGAGLGSTSNASSPRGSASTFIRAMSESCSRNSASPHQCAAPSSSAGRGDRRGFQNVWAAPSARGFPRSASDQSASTYPASKGLLPAMMEIRALRERRRYCYLLPGCILYDLDYLTANQQYALKAGLVTDSYSYNTFKVEVLVARALSLGAGSVQPSTNAFKIAANGPRRSADVVCAFGTVGISRMGHFTRA